MIKGQSESENIELWYKLINQEKIYLKTRQTFLNSCQDKVEIIRKALQNPTERGTALQLFIYLTEDERQSLFDELLKLASVGHADIELVRKAILSFSKTWLLNHIEKSAKLVLDKGTDEEYRRILELYINIDHKLTEKLIQQALQQENLNIREVGEDFQNYLKDTIQ